MSALKQIVEAQAKTHNTMDNICKELWDRVDFLTEKENILSKKKDKGKGEGRYEGILNKKYSGD